MNFSRVVGMCAGIGVLLVLGAVRSQGQVFVYKLHLQEQQGKQLNFDFYERGYFIAPAAEAGTGTFIFTANDGADLKFYSVAKDAGRYFMVKKNSERKAVVFSSSANGSANSVYMVIGEANSTFNFGGEIGRVRYAEKLSGYVLAADDDSDPVYDDGSASTAGFAGMSTMTFTLDEARTGSASRNDKTAEDVTAELVRYLESYGYEGEGFADGSESEPGGNDDKVTTVSTADGVDIVSGGGDVILPSPEDSGDSPVEVDGEPGAVVVVPETIGEVYGWGEEGG